tara:strand:- start:281 stop:499 length:219 start_codon:yes stop_codon:yes gene_type:complete
MNTYYIIPAEDIEILQYNNMIEGPDTALWSLDNTKFVCKTQIGSEPLVEYTNYTNEEIKLEIQEAEWSSENI